MGKSLLKKYGMRTPFALGPNGQTQLLIGTHLIRGVKPAGLWYAP